MRFRKVLFFWQLAAVLLFLSSSFAAAQTRVEQGRDVLNCVRVMHLLFDFGIEALPPDKYESFSLGMELIGDDDTDSLGESEWFVRYQMLQVEQLGRDMLAGKPISDAHAKILDRYFKTPIDPVWGCRVDKEAARQAEESLRKLHQTMAAKLIAGQSLDENEYVMRRRNYRSGDQLAWLSPNLSFDVAAMLKAYPAADQNSKHVMRMLIGLRGQADKQTVAFLLSAIKGKTPIERYDAAIAAGKLRPASDQLISALIECLADPDPRVARASTRSLLVLDAKKSAPAMLRRLRDIIEDEAIAELAAELRFGFYDYDIMDSHIGFRYDLPTEIIYALGLFRHREAEPLLWEIVKGKGEDVWHCQRIYELDHGGVAVEAIFAMDAGQSAVTARRVLAMDNVTVDAMGSAANLLGECGKLADVPMMLKLMTMLDTTARQTPKRRYGMSRAMTRATFAAERLVFFADASNPKYKQIRQNLIVTLRNCADGPFGEPLIAALEYFDPEHVETTAMTLAADVEAEPNVRQIATEILARSKNLKYVEPLINLFEDDGNALNGPVGLHAAHAVSKILAAVDHTDPKVAALVQQAADKIEQMDIDREQAYYAVLIRLDSDRGVRVCSRIALDNKASRFERIIALKQIAAYAQPNRILAVPLRPLLDFAASPSESHDTPIKAEIRNREATEIRIYAARAMAKLLGITFEEKQQNRSAFSADGPIYDPTLANMVRKELDKPTDEE